MNQEPVVVERDGIPVAVILSCPCYEQLLQELKVTRFDQLSRAAGLEAEQQGLTEDQLEREIESVREQLYQEAYG